MAVLEKRGRESKPASSTEQRRGIDLHVRGAAGEWTTVQVKACERAQDTGNMFVEVVQIDTWGDPGWVWTCSAEWLAYWVPATGDCLWFRPDGLRAHTIGWRNRYGRRGSKRVQNEDYQTIGWPIPWGVAMDAADAVWVGALCRSTGKVVAKGRA
jgi:hypothetical protein